MKCGLAPPARLLTESDRPFASTEMLVAGPVCPVQDACSAATFESLPSAAQRAESLSLQSLKVSPGPAAWRWSTRERAREARHLDSPNREAQEEQWLKLPVPARRPEG